MELILNLVWVLVAAGAFACWCRTRVPAQEGTRKAGPQLFALGVLLLILFPAISITDDLWAVRNPAETDTLLRRFDAGAHHQGIPLHGPPSFLVSRFQPPRSVILGRAATVVGELAFLPAPARPGISIRPPPVV